jgi:hypothetical protein
MASKIIIKKNKRGDYVAETYVNDKDLANSKKQFAPKVDVQHVPRPTVLSYDEENLRANLEAEIVAGDFSRVNLFYKHCKQTYDCYGFVLEYAAYHGNMENVKLALSKHADQIDVAFKVACQRNQLDIAKVLLKKIYEGYNRMSHDQIKSMFELALVCAHQENHEEILTFLYKQIDENGVNWLTKVVPV